MKKTARQFGLVLLVCAAALSLPGLARAQSLTVVLSGNLVTWNNLTGNPLTPGSATNNGSVPIAVTTSWNNVAPPGQNRNLGLWAYFNSATAALAHVSCTTSCSDIPSSAFEMRVNGGPLLPLNQTAPWGVGGAARQIFALRITGQNKTGVAVHNLVFNINLATLPNLPVDSYSGTLFIQAQAVI